jgi:acyl carrier protein
LPRLKEKKIMREKIISILSELRPEFDFSEPVNFIEEGMLDSFDIVTLVDTEYDIVIDGIDIIPENFDSLDSIVRLLQKNGVNE